MITKVFGPPGTGKTTFLLDIVEKAIKEGIKPERIAFMSFTKKAATEAIDRASSRFNLSHEAFPWFRTIHSMAFKHMAISAQDVMQTKHYKQIGAKLGYHFSNTSFASINVDDMTPVMYGRELGDWVVQIESLARLRGISISDQYLMSTRTPYPFDVQEWMVQEWSEALNKFKAENGMVDFTGMLEKYNEPILVDLFIIDEAQDLCPLQWTVVNVASSNAKQVYIAGDDDQCIFSWAGASPKAFCALQADDVIILPKSHRVPRQMQAIASYIAEGIRYRQPKHWQSSGEEGDYREWQDENMCPLRTENECTNRDGSKMFLARNGFQLYRWTAVLRHEGIPYTKDGQSSTDNKETRAIMYWEHWRKGRSLTSKEVTAIKRYLPGLAGFQPNKDTQLSETPLSVDLVKLPWYKVLDIAPEAQEYYRACLDNGHRLLAPPNALVSTIHRVKGGEADHVYLISDVTRQQIIAKDSDAELRVQYVAMTRAKKSMNVLSQNSKFAWRFYA